MARCLSHPGSTDFTIALTRRTEAVVSCWGVEYTSCLHKCIYVLMSHTSSSEHLYVVVPCKNEVTSVSLVVEEVLSHAPNLQMPLSVIMIDDGSTDGTLREMERICSTHDGCDIIMNPQNIGVGRSVMNAYDHVPKGAWVSVMPGDGEFVFGASIDNFMKVREEYEVILGYLYNPIIRNLRRRLASYAFTKATATLYGFPWRYLNGLKMYKVDAFRDIEVVSSGHAFMAELIAKAHLRNPSLRIGEAPFFSRGRGAGMSKAIQPINVTKAVIDVVNGARSVGEYRDKMVKASATEGAHRPRHERS